MAVDATAGEHLPIHRLPVSAVLALARGDGDDAIVEKLLRAERSRRLLLLRALDNGVPHQGLPGAYTQAWTLLARVQRHAPATFEQVLMSPGTGMWVSLAVRRIRGRAYEDAPLWVVVGHLAALAAAAAARSGLDFSITVPARGGRVPLPTLGCAVLPEAEPWSTVRVEGRGGRLRITGRRGQVEVAPGWDRRGDGWLPVRRIVLGTGDQAMPLFLEELDPYRTFPRPSEPRVLSGAEAQRWESLLSGAWDVLLRDEPETARAMRRGLTSLAPTPARERFRPHSSTAGDAFGGVTASCPDDVPQLAATLVHEFQHTKLGGLMHLGALTEPPPVGQEREELFYAPWRDDPRPLGGLLQGIYAFFGVTRFWRTHRHAADRAYAPLAHFEFALWRTQVWCALNTVWAHERLTPLGRTVVEELAERCAPWMTDEVPATPLRLAQEAASDHLARWRAHHLRPPSTAVQEAVAAWRRGDAQPPPALSARPTLVPDNEVRFLDSAAVLARYHLTEPGGSWRHAAAVDGADESDVLLACGDHTAARAALTVQLLGKGSPVSAWASLGRSLAGDPSHAHASALLLRFPERARAVQEALAATPGGAPNPLDLAGWLGGPATP